MTAITLPWPPSSLSGHAKGHWRAKYVATRKHRNWARLATMDAKVRGLPADGDIRVCVAFTPPDRPRLGR